MELLIVIGVLGILAAGLLAAIDPFEQLKKARDTNNRNAATELLQANQRYYATHGYLPWLKEDACTDASLDVLRPVTPVTTYPLSYLVVSKSTSTDYNAILTTCLEDTLGADGEIKATFSDGLSTSLYLTSGSKTRVGVCFSPEAKSNRTDPATKYYLDTANNQVIVTGLPSGVVCPDPNAEEENCLQCFE